MSQSSRNTSYLVSNHYPVLFSLKQKQVTIYAMIKSVYMRSTTITIWLATTLFSAGVLAAEESPTELKPLWELGFGGGVLNAPDYPSSAEKSVRALVLPYIVYRGEVFRIGDGQSARAVAFENDRIEMDLSFVAAFDADSEDNDLRQDMPDLDYMFQIGPQVKIKLADFSFADTSTSSLTLALQARGVFSSDLGSFDQRGYVFEPMLQYKHLGLLSPKLEATISLKPQWASRQLHEYFYDVDAEYVTSQRSAYSADEGYFGTGLNVYTTYRINEKINTFFGIQTNFHHGAANVDSPLYEKDFTVGFGAGFIIKFSASERMVSLE